MASLFVLSQAVTMLLSACRLSFSSACSRILYFIILPAAFIGNSVTKSTCRGDVLFATKITLFFRYITTYIMHLLKPFHFQLNYRYDEALIISRSFNISHIYILKYSNLYIRQAWQTKRPPGSQLIFPERL